MAKRAKIANIKLPAGFLQSVQEQSQPKVTDISAVAVAHRSSRNVSLLPLYQLKTLCVCVLVH